MLDSRGQEAERWGDVHGEGSLSEVPGPPRPSSKQFGEPLGVKRGRAGTAASGTPWVGGGAASGVKDETAPSW